MGLFLKFTEYNASLYPTLESAPNGLYHVSGTQCSLITDKPSSVTGQFYMVKSKMGNENFIQIWHPKDQQVFYKTQFGSIISDWHSFVKSSDLSSMIITDYREGTFTIPANSTIDAEISLSDQYSNWKIIAIGEVYANNRNVLVTSFSFSNSTKKSTIRVRNISSSDIEALIFCTFTIVRNQ